MYSKRRELVFEATERFINTGITNNITEAMEMLMAERPEDERVPIMVSTKEMPSPRGRLERLERPKCELCYRPMRLRIGRPQDDFKTSWVCEHCLVEEFTDYPVEYWLATLPRKKDNMIIGDKKVEPKRRNVLEEECPLCGNKLREVSPCCGQPYTTIRCTCGFKRIKKVD